MTLPITDEKLVNKIVTSVEKAIKISSGEKQINPFRLLEHITIQRALTQLENDLEGQNYIRYFGLTNNLEALYQYIDLPHQSGQRVSDIFPPALITELMHSSDTLITAFAEEHDNNKQAVLELQAENQYNKQQLSDLSLELLNTCDKNMQLAHYIQNKEDIFIQEKEALQQEIVKMQAQHLDQSVKLKSMYEQDCAQQIEAVVQDISKRHETQIAELKDQLSSAQSNTGVFDTATLPGKLNIAFAAIISIMIIISIANMVMKYKTHNNQNIIDNRVADSKKIAS